MLAADKGSNIGSRRRIFLLHQTLVEDCWAACSMWKNWTPPSLDSVNLALLKFRHEVIEYGHNKLPNFNIVYYNAKWIFASLKSYIIHNNKKPTTF